ncbi:RTA1-domain-containing protein [Thozetella sp. PMI_491]|nr:RTA1-domain-containing protein [Thozetella sp. PMI_491]
MSGGRFYVCKEVNQYCPVEATTLGYYPNVGINVFLAAGFGIAGVVTLVTGIWKKTYSYMGFIAAGCFLELAGYAARVPMHANPWNQNAFQTQICAIILAPTLICISIYLTLKHLCLSLNPSLSRVRPRLYPFIFVPADVSCLLVQAIGGALAASSGASSAHPNLSLIQGGNRAIIAGIALQVVVLLGFGIASTDYYLRVKKWIASDEATPEATALWVDKKFRMFVYAVTVAYFAILVRCIYRIAEMAGGWGNKIMQDEPSFIVLDGVMVLLASCLLAFFPPGLLFPPMAARMQEATKRRFNKKKSSDPGEESQEAEVSESHPEKQVV